MRKRKAVAALLAATLIIPSCGGQDDFSDTALIRIDNTRSSESNRGQDRTETTGEHQATATTTAADAIAGGDSTYRSSRGESVPVTTTTMVTDANFEDYGTNPFEDPAVEPLSTFAVDVDTGSYTLMRAWIEQGVLPDPDSVRVEEYVNYFDGGYPAPVDSTFAVYADGAPTPFWDSRNDILRIGVKAREIEERRRQDMNLTLVIDVSGSMGDSGKLDMVKEALEVLVDELDRFDSVSIIAYNTDAELILEPTSVGESDVIVEAIDELRASGSTNAEAGLRLGYEVADASYAGDSVNRVVLLSDGVANVGSTGPEGILETIGEHTRRGIDLVTVGVGISTYNDVLLEQLADQGDGWYAYIDSADEAERLFRDRLTTTLEAVARDVKVQVEFDPEYVLEYRLIGFENRAIDDEDFRSDRVDAGDINAGHSVTALYEVALTRDAYRGDATFATVRLRWSDEATGRVEEIEGDVHTRLLGDRFDDANARFQLATAVAAYAEVLRESRWVRGLDLDELLDEIDRLPWRDLDDEVANEFRDLVAAATRLDR